MLTRRELLRASAGAGALLVARPMGVLAQSLGPAHAHGTSRASRLFPGTWVAHADMHNHTLLSDGAGAAEDAFGSMRDAGLDVASLPDHTTISTSLPQSICLGNHDCQSVAGLDQAGWEVSRQLADAHQVDGQFAALRGFEWSSPTLGHINVWFTTGFIDPLVTGGLGTPDDLLRFAEAEGLPLPTEFLPLMDELIRQTPAAGLGMRAFYEWLNLDPSTPGLGGGADGIFGFNHPGREAGRFSEFVFDPSLVDRLVSLELFNRREDYLFERIDRGYPSALVACLDAGWRPGILGVTDEHGTDWGYPDGKGRAGMWVTELSREGIREAMENRRFYATNLKGLRLDAAANGVRMGQTLGHTGGAIRFDVDIDRGRAWWGKRLRMQVLGTGSPLPTILEEVEVTVPRGNQPVISFPVDVNPGDHRWVVLRVTDPELEADGRAAGTPYAAAGGAIAYASPFYLDPDGPPPAPADPRMQSASPTPVSAPLPTTGGGLGPAAALLLAAGAGALALRGRHAVHQDHDHDGPHNHV